MELEELMQESVQALENDFYNKKFYFSYSSLNKLLWSPQVFYQMYVLGNKEEKMDAHLVQGKVIHCLLLEPEHFDDVFLVSPANLPTGNIRTVVDRVYYQYFTNQASYDSLGAANLSDFQDEILDAMKEIGYHQSLKTDQQRLDKVISTEANNYFQFLKQKGSKTLIDQETHEFCKSAVDIIKTDNNICSLIGCNITAFDNKEVFNEQPMQVEWTKMGVGLKGIIDNIVIDHDKKVIYINDIKTTSKDLKDFTESIEYYSYWLQAVMYFAMAGMQYKELIEDKGYGIRFHFVVIDRTFQTYAFPVSENTMVNWLERFEKSMEKAKWHLTNKSFFLPYDFATGSVTL